MEDWELKHDWWIEDFQFESLVKRNLVRMLKRHPDDEIGVLLREMCKEQDKLIARMKREYKKTYGCNFNINRLKNEKKRYWWSVNKKR